MLLPPGVVHGLRILKYHPERTELVGRSRLLANGGADTG
jgi:hypothetical protein